MTTPDNLQRTPLFDIHESIGGRMVPFGGWEMPIQYASILQESRAVRSAAGIFDVSHMGRVDINGSGAVSFLDRILSTDVRRLRIGQARYNVICDEDGGIIDDCIIYRRGDERYLLIPNAGNTTQVLAWLDRWNLEKSDVRIENVTSKFAMIAYQGPNAVASLNDIAEADLSQLRPFRTVDTRLNGIESFIARTGYTGEDGVEMIVPSEAASDLWKTLVDLGGVPCGLGARDVLRMEAGLLLHGNDMDTSTNPYEAGLEKFVNPDRDSYVAGPVLRQIRDAGVARKLVGFDMVERGIPRAGFPILVDENVVGNVTSGGFSPTLDRSIGLGYVPTGATAAGTDIYIDIRGRPVAARITTLPFYSRRRSA